MTDRWEAACRGEGHKVKEEAHTEEALWSSEQPQDTAGGLNSDRRESGGALW